MNRYCQFGLRLVLAFVVTIAAGIAVQAEPAHKLVAQGNAAFASGEFERALSLYEEASVELPEAAQVYFNRGAVFYKQEKFEEAIESFREAAVKSREPALSSRAKFNLGNSAFRQAERQRDSDLKKAIEHCRDAIAYYQEAHDLDPDYKEAAENIEIVRLYIKVLLDEQQKRQEEEEQQENLVQKLQKLIERQKGLSKGNAELVAGKPDGSDSNASVQWKDAVEALAGEQGVLRDDTRSVQGEIEQNRSQLEQAAAAAGQNPDPAQPQPQPPAQGQPSPEEMQEMLQKFGEAAGHVTNAVASEEAARAQIAAAALPTAGKNQDSAVQSLEEAVKALADPDQQQQQNQSGDQSQDQNDQAGDEEQKEQKQEDQADQEQGGEKEEEQEGEQGEQGQKPGEEEKSPEEQAREARMERAEDILDEEKENQKQRPVRRGQVLPVDRVW
jgi:tetratricopeptide (TPR) repeat protein